MRSSLKFTHIDRNNMLVHVGEYCEVVCVSTAVQTVVEQQILSKIPDALKLSKYVQNCEI